MSENTSNPENLPQVISQSPEDPSAVPGNEVPISDVPELKGIAQALTEEVRKKLKFTPAQLKKILRNVEAQKFCGEHGSLPMVCKTTDCPIRETCPLDIVGRAPEGERCPVEIEMMNTWLEEYRSSMDIQWSDKIEREAVMDLVECDIFQARANGILSSEGFVMENNVGVSASTGEAVMRKEVHVAMVVKDMLHKRKERLLKSLVATRETKKKLGVSGNDPAKREAELLERIRQSKMREQEDERKRLEKK